MFKELTGFGLSLVAVSVMASSLEIPRFIIKYNNHLTTVTTLVPALSKVVGLPLTNAIVMPDNMVSLAIDKTVLSAFPDNDYTALSKRILRQLVHAPNVIFAQLDRIGHINPLPVVSKENERLTLSHALQWDEFKRPGGVMLESLPGLSDGAWAYTMGGSKPPIVVAVLDTGIELHDSLIDNLARDKKGQLIGWNFAANNSNFSDETRSYHGTHVAGTIAGYGQILSGIGPQLTLLPVKIPDASGMFYESSVINGIYWSVGGSVPGVPDNPMPAKVLNMSFGVDVGPGKESDNCGLALQNAMNFARMKGAVVMVAAGNDNIWEHYNAPGVCNGAIKVAATGPEGLRAFYSNYGPGISFAAPGGDTRYGMAGGILSTVNPGGGYQGSGFDFYQGTSMASPHAAGIAALVFAVKGGRITPEHVEKLLYTTTHAFGDSLDANKSCVGEMPCGHGILDAENAVKAALGNYDVLLSAPTFRRIKTACKNPKMIQTAQVEWLPINTVGCSSLHEGLTKLSQNKDGVIIAQYESVQYQLVQSHYQYCEVIGVDGIGCIR